MGAHNFDPAFNALALDAPLTIEAKASEIDPERSVGSHMVIYKFGAQADRSAITAFWYDNGFMAPTPLGVDPDDARQRLGEAGNGLLIVGDKGSITCPGWSGMPRLLPSEDAAARGRPSRRLAAGLHGRHARVQQFRVRRSFDRIHPPRQRRSPIGQGAQMGRGDHESDQCPGRTALHRGKLPEGVGTAGVAAR
jgi:hypothetical protein